MNDSLKVTRGFPEIMECQTTRAERESHPAFARIYERWSRVAERRGVTEHRKQLLAGLTGRVIEVGAGNGANFSHYPAAVSEVVAVEPERYLRERAQEAAANAPVAVTVLDGVASQLPGEDQSFDAGVVALVLCTVPDPHEALTELYRVIYPGGELRFYEHVVANSKWEARFQRLADATFWPRVAGGCHLARDTEANIVLAGFQIASRERFVFSPVLPFLHDPMILGTARRL